MKKIIFLVLVVAYADVWAMKLEIRPGYNKEASETLLNAVRFPHPVESVKRAIAAGADVNVKNDDGFTPLHFVAQKNETEENIEALIAAGADVNAKANDGHTPLHLAVILFPKIETIKALIAAGADVNAKSNAGETPLHSISLGENLKEVIQALIAAGADVNAKNNYGETPLYKVALIDSNPKETIKALIESGATIPMDCILRTPDRYRLHPSQVEQLDSVIEKINEERELYNDALRGFSALGGK
ncbi:ankyrin repeat domain-containing protein, partial [Candidatus Babeliales bacterium]|nr:ankyrin repeat domain-containing protein [Candidatus Babeliales bacterium]